MNQSLSKADIKRLRESEVYKFDNKSDFLSIRHCYKIAKQLYECLKYFDSRASRFTFDSPNKKLYNSRRSFAYPQEYFKFQLRDVDISIYRFMNDYNVVVQGAWRPSCLGEEIFSCHGNDVLIPNFHRYYCTDSLSDCIDAWLHCVQQFIFDKFNSMEII